MLFISLRFACWITKVTDTHTEYLILVALPMQKWLPESASILRHVILHEIRKRIANWIGHILRRNCLLKQVIKGKIKEEMEVTRRRGRRRKKLLDDLTSKDRRGYSYLKEEALDRSGPGGVVGIATAYGLDGPGIETRCG